MKPVLQALVVADRVYEDKATGKKIIVGTFSRLRFQQRRVSPGGSMEIPIMGHQAGSPFAYVSLTDIHEQAELSVRYVRLDLDDGHPEDPIFRTNVITIECPDKIATVELIVPLPMLPLVPGVFAIEVMCEDEILGAHRIVIADETKDEDVQMAIAESEVREGWKATPTDPVSIRWVKRPFRVLLCEEPEGGYSVHCLDLAGIVSQAETAREAIDNIKEAITGALASFKESGQEIPYTNVQVDEAPTNSKELLVLVNV